MNKLTRDMNKNRLKCQFLITDSESGLVDGYYRTVGIAEQVSEDLAKRFGRPFDISEIEGVPPYIPDSMMFSKSVEYNNAPFGRK